MRIPKNKFLLLAIPALLIVSWLANSCKKNDNQDSIMFFLADNGVWRLASLRVDNYRGDTLRIDTLNRDCKFTQQLDFSSDGSCSYRYYSCLDNAASGRWSLSSDRLVIQSDMTCKDTSAKGSVQPFKRAQIVSLGQNSLILTQTDTLSAPRVRPLVRKITRYSFIH